MDSKGVLEKLWATEATSQELRDTIDKLSQELTRKLQMEGNCPCFCEDGFTGQSSSNSEEPVIGFSKKARQEGPSFLKWM